MVWGFSVPKISLLGVLTDEGVRRSRFGLSRTACTRGADFSRGLKHLYHFIVIELAGSKYSDVCAWKSWWMIHQTHSKVFWKE